MKQPKIIPIKTVLHGSTSFPLAIESHEKSPTGHRSLGETQTMSLALGANPEGKERAKSKAIVGCKVNE